jgi:hypothetical protein
MQLNRPSALCHVEVHIDAISSSAPYHSIIPILGLGIVEPQTCYVQGDNLLPLCTASPRLLRAPGQTTYIIRLLRTVFMAANAYVNGAEAHVSLVPVLASQRRFVDLRQVGLPIPASQTTSSIEPTPSRRGMFGL